MEYQILRSNRKTAAIQITGGGEVLVRCPYRMPLWEIEALVESKRVWIEKHLRSLNARPKLPLFTEAELSSMAASLLEDLRGQVPHYAKLLGVTFGKVTVRCQKTLWGSCSSQGNLNFNCLLSLAPPEVRDYVIVHELCHRLEMNHSPAFWAKVEHILPDYKNYRKWLKDNGSLLIARLPG